MILGSSMSSQCVAFLSKPLSLMLVFHQFSEAKHLVISDVARGTCTLVSLCGLYGFVRLLMRTRGRTSRETPGETRSPLSKWPSHVGLPRINFWFCKNSARKYVCNICQTPAKSCNGHIMVDVAYS